MYPRVLGGASLLALGLNGVVGVGIFFLPAVLAARAPGPVGLVVLVATALALLPVALTFAVLGRRFPEDGGPVLYARAAFGDKAAFLIGWISYLSAVASAAAVLAGLCHYSLASWMHLGGLSKRVAAVALAAVLAVLSALGLRFSAGVWNLLTFLKLVPLVGLAVLGLLAGGPSLRGASLPSLGGVAGAALSATFAFQGFEVISVVAGHVRGGERAVPRAMMGSLLLAALLYGLLHGACLGAVARLSSSQAPLVEAARALGGEGWAVVLGAGANLSALGIAFGMVAMTPRYLAALGPELGEAISRESPRGVPLGALAVTAVLVSALLALGSLGSLLVLSSVAVLAQYGVTALALLRLALRSQAGLRPRDAWPAPLALVATGILVSGATWREAVVAAVALALGWALRRWRTSLAPPSAR
jgi:APA family basic amino acid/polyamine antiporter